MRSRYTAFVIGDVDYLLKTRHPKHISATEKEDVAAFINDVDSWESLDILICEDGLETDSQGIVAFTVHYIHRNQRQSFYECSRFSKVNGNWMYESGD